MPPDAPLPELTQDVISYDITGATHAELRAQLDALGPEDDSGRHDAYTKWFVRWAYDYDRSVETQCRLTNVRATVEVKMTLPRWANESGALAERWQQYLAALRTHENGHVQNAVDAARFIVVDLQALPVSPDCDSAAVAANAKASESIELAHARDKDYDAETKHGATQGATFR